MKVKSFKLLPGVKHQGADNETLHNDAAVERLEPTTDNTDLIGHSASADAPAPAPTSVDTPPIRPARRADVDTCKFKNEFVLSVDGERYNPGHGIICEVHQGLAHFIADSKLQKYRPSVLFKTRKDNAASGRGDYDEGEDGVSEQQLTQSRWMHDMEAQLRHFEGQEPGVQAF